jgi:DNA-binding transcriptional ArsR family regulator
VVIASGPTASSEVAGRGRGAPDETSYLAPGVLRESAARRFKALSHPVRLRLIELLARGGKSVSELAQITGVRADTVSKHLQTLAAVNIVRRCQQGNFARYSMGEPEVQRLVALGYRAVMREAAQLHTLAELAGKPSDDGHVPGTANARAKQRSKPA